MQGAYKVSSSIWDRDEVFKDLSEKSNPLLDAVYHASPDSFCDVSVASEIRIEDGMGSSSALRLGAFSALCREREAKTLVRDWKSSQQIARAAYKRQLEDQGAASGYDIITQLHGGLVVMEAKKDLWPGPYSAPSVDSSDWVHVLVGGKGAPTEQQMGSTTKWLKDQGLWDELKEASEELVDEMLAFFKAPSAVPFKKLLERISTHRKIFRDSPKFPKKLSSFLEAQHGFEENWTYKTTGAGGEDAVLLFGKKEDLEPLLESVAGLGWTLFEGSFSELGAHVVAED